MLGGPHVARGPDVAQAFFRPCLVGNIETILVFAGKYKFSFFSKKQMGHILARKDQNRFQRGSPSEKISVD